MPIQHCCCIPLSWFLGDEERPDPTPAGAQTAPSESGPSSQAPQGASHDEAPSVGSSNVPTKSEEDDVADVSGVPGCYKAPPGSSNVSLKYEGEDVGARLNVSEPPRCDDASSSGSSNVPKAGSEEEDVAVNRNASGAPPCINEASTSGSSNVPNTGSEEEDADVNPNVSGAPPCINEASTSGSSNVSGAPPCINEAPSCSSSSGATKSRSDLTSSIRKDVEDVNLDDLMNHIYELLKLREEGKQQQASNRRKFLWPNVTAFQNLKETLSFVPDLQKFQNMLSAALTFGSELKDIIHGSVTGLLNGIGKVSVALLVVAHTLERFDDVSTNKDKCWHLIKEMSYVASVVKRLKESPQGMAQVVITEATSLLVEGVIMFCNEIERSTWQRLLAALKIKGDLSAITKKLQTMYLKINTEIGFRLLSAVEREGRSPLSKGYPTHAVGINEPVKKVLRLLEIESDEKAATVILHGLGGMGKTTLAEAVFSEVGGCKYSKVCFFKGINSTLDIIELQKLILKDLVEPGETIPDIRIPDDGRRELERVLANVDAFIYIDNVLEASALRMLLPHDITKAKKVRLLLTAREDVVKISCSGTIPKIYKMEGIQHRDALIILKTKIKKGINDSQFNDIIEACGGIPLMLTLAASFIGVDDNKQEAYSRLMREKQKWTGDEFEEMRCVFAYDAIPRQCKDPFLDICSYFRGWDWEAVEDIVGKDELRMLESRALVTKATYAVANKATYAVASVHDVILTLARQKSEEESNGKEVRKIFTSARELKKFLEEEDTQGIKGIWLARDYGAALHICASKLDSMHNSLRVLHFETPTKVEGNCTNIFKELIYLEANIIQLPFHVSQLKQLRYLSCEFPEAPQILQLVNFHGSWQSRAFQVLSTDFIQLRNLRVLIFNNFTKLKELPKELGKLASLRVLDLRGCESIRKLPEGLDQLKNLKELVLKGCRNLTELCNDFSSLSLQILDVSECDRLEQFPGNGSCPSTDISVQAFSISESQKENIENNVLSKFDRILTDGRGEPFHLSDLPPNTPVLVICDTRGLWHSPLPNFPWHLIKETIYKRQKKFPFIYIGQHSLELPSRIKDRICVIRLRSSAVQKVLKQVCLTLDAAVPSGKRISYLQMHTKTGEKSDNYRPCWGILTEGKLEEFVVCNSLRYLRLKQLAETNEESSNIELLIKLFAPGGDETTPVFEKKDSSGQVTTCGVDQLKGKTILLDLRSYDSFDDFGLPYLKEMYDVVVEQKLDLEIISIPIRRPTDSSGFWRKYERNQEHIHFLREVRWFVVTRVIRRVAMFFLTKQCGWEEGDECEKWYASINCIIEPNGRVIPCRPFTKYTEPKSTPVLEFLFNHLERASDQVKTIMFQLKWGVKACPTVHEEIENLKKEEWEQLKSRSTLEFLFNHLESEFLFNHLESTSHQVKKLICQGKIICLCSSYEYERSTQFMYECEYGWDQVMNEMDQFKKDIHVITIGDTRMERLLLTDTIYKNCLKRYTIPTDVEKMSSLSLSSHEHMRFSSRLHYLKEEINRIKESDKKLSELKSVLQSLHDERSMTFMDQYGKVVATLGKNNMELIFRWSKNHRAQLFIKSMMKDIEGGGNSLIQNMQTASTSVAVEQEDMDAYFESLREYTSELWGVELYQLLKFNKDGKKSSPSRVTWPDSRGFCMLENFLSEGTNANWVVRIKHLQNLQLLIIFLFEHEFPLGSCPAYIANIESKFFFCGFQKDVISRHPEEDMCTTVIKRLLNDIEEENWGVAGLLAVKHVLERFDSVSANRIDWLFVLDEMLIVAQYVKQLNQKPELSWRRIKRVAIVSIVICSIACSALIDPSKFALLELPTVDNGLLGGIRYDLELIGNNMANAITDGLDGESGSELDGEGSELDGESGSKLQNMCDLELIGNNMANAITEGLDGESGSELDGEGSELDGESGSELDGEGSELDGEGSELQNMCHKFDLFFGRSW